jgi:hypothetical protein
MMHSSDFRRIIDILTKESFRGVLNISGGEPTLHPDLPAMLAYCSMRLRDARIVVFTNGHWVGNPRWQATLKGLFAGRNILVRFSLDRQHAEGAALASGYTDEQILREIEVSRFWKAHAFFDACVAEGLIPGEHFDFAFKGSAEEAGGYLSTLGEAPVYLIRFQKDPANRQKELGYFAVDLSEDGQPLVFLTLGHIPSGESLGGIENLPEALEINRKALLDADLSEKGPLS